MKLMLKDSDIQSQYTMMLKLNEDYSFLLKYSLFGDNKDGCKVSIESNRKMFMECLDRVKELEIEKNGIL